MMLLVPSFFGLSSTKTHWHHKGYLGSNLHAIYCLGVFFVFFFSNKKSLCTEVLAVCLYIR